LLNVFCSNSLNHLNRFSWLIYLKIQLKKNHVVTILYFLPTPYIILKYFMEIYISYCVFLCSLFFKLLFIPNLTQYFIHPRFIYPSFIKQNFIKFNSNISIFIHDHKCVWRGIILVKWREWGYHRFLGFQNEKQITEPNKVGLNWFGSVLHQTREDRILFRYGSVWTFDFVGFIQTVYTPIYGSRQRVSLEY